MIPQPASLASADDASRMGLRKAQCSAR